MPITRLKARMEEVKLGEQTTGNIYGPAGI